MSGTNTQDQVVNGKLFVNGPTFGASTLTGDKGVLTGDGASTEKFPGMVSVSGDPSIVGRAAEVASICLDTSTGSWYRKTGAADTAWVLAAGGAGPLTGSPLVLTPWASPGALTVGATVNDWQPDGSSPTVPYSKTSTLRMTTTVGAGVATVTGIDATAGSGIVNGQVVFAENFGPQPIVFSHENAGSSPTNRFNLPDNVDVTVNVGETIGLIYDGNETGGTGSLRWRCISLAQAGGAYPLSLYVGDGGDGSHTVSGTEALGGANRAYLDLNVPAGAILRPQGGLIQVMGTFTLGGVVEVDGGAGGAGTVSSGGGGGAQGGATGAAYCGNGTTGATGSTGNQAGQAGTASNAGKTWTCLVPGNAAGGTASTNGSPGGGAGQGGGGGGSSTQAGGAGGVVGTNTPASQGTHHMATQRFTARPLGGSGVTVSAPWELGTGGGSGGAATGAGASGGGGGSAGCLVILCTNFVDLGGVLRAKGGDAGAGVLSTSAGVGGSGGGGGGVIVFASFGRAQPTPANCIVTGGIGAGGLGAGHAGGNGAAGVVLKGNPVT